MPAQMSQQMGLSQKVNGKTLNPKMIQKEIPYHYQNGTGLLFKSLEGARFFYIVPVFGQGTV